MSSNFNKIVSWAGKKKEAKGSKRHLGFGNSLSLLYHSISSLSRIFNLMDSSRLEWEDMLSKTMELLADERVQSFSRKIQKNKSARASELESTNSSPTQSLESSTQHLDQLYKILNRSSSRHPSDTDSPRESDAFCESTDEWKEGEPQEIFHEPEHNNGVEEDFDTSRAIYPHFPPIFYDSVSALSSQAQHFGGVQDVTPREAQPFRIARPNESLEDFTHNRNIPFQLNSVQNAKSHPFQPKSPSSSYWPTPNVLPKRHFFTQIKTDPASIHQSEKPQDEIKYSNPNFTSRSLVDPVSPDKHVQFKRDFESDFSSISSSNHLPDIHTENRIEPIQLQIELKSHDLFHASTLTSYSNVLGISLFQSSIMSNKLSLKPNQRFLSRSFELNSLESMHNELSNTIPSFGILALIAGLISLSANKTRVYFHLLGLSFLSFFLTLFVIFLKRISKFCTLLFTDNINFNLSPLSYR